MNPIALLKLVRAKKDLENRHPKAMAFVRNELDTDLPEGTIIEVTVTKPGQAPVSSNFRITAEDLKLAQEVKNIKEQDG